MNQQAYDAAIAAAYAARKYLLAVDAAVDSFEVGENDTPGNTGLVKQHWNKLQESAERAIELHEQAKRD